MMLPAYTAAAVYAAEAPALAAGLPLMARAARALADVVTAHVPALAPVAVIAGRGNNGADALYAAAHLAHAGHPVTALLSFDPAAEPGESGRGAVTGALRTATDAGVRVVGPEDAHAVREAAAAGVWIDGLTGIGLHPPVRGALGDLLALLAAEHRRAAPPVVFAVDLPSGLAADGGTRDGPVIPADHTVTFGAHKAAHFLPPAAHLCGRVHLIDIGIAEQFARQEAAVQRVEPADLAAWWPRPRVHDHKYTRGVLALATGSRDYPGAATLSVHGALATGPGMVRYLGEVPGHVTGAHPEVVTHLGRAQAWVAGSGITGRTSSAAPGVDAAVAEARRAGVPIVLDAGALEWVDTAWADGGGAGREGAAGTDSAARVVLTPHAGELAALLDRLGHEVSREDVEADPGRWAAAVAEATGATVVLKGAITLVRSAGLTFSQAEGTPWMATAGSGDVLAGILGAVLATWQVAFELDRARAWPSFGHAVAAGVALHGLAGTRASGGGPITASDVARAVPGVLRDLL